MLPCAITRTRLCQSNSIKPSCNSVHYQVFTVQTQPGTITKFPEIECKTMFDEAQLHGYCENDKLNCIQLKVDVADWKCWSNRFILHCYKSIIYWLVCTLIVQTSQLKVNFENKCRYFPPANQNRVKEGKSVHCATQQNQ